MPTAQEFLTNVIRPVLTEIGLHSPAAEQLLLGTAIQESDLVHRRQLGGGPGRGYYQMEPNTHNDIWENYLRYRGQHAAKIMALLPRPDADKIAELENNDRYATGMARIHYLRVPASLPQENDIQAMANYWKQYYNTPLGAGTPEQFVEKWNQIMAGI